MDTHGGERAIDRAATGSLEGDARTQTFPEETGLPPRPQGPGCDPAGTLEGLQTEEGVSRENGVLEEASCHCCQGTL